MRCFSVEFFVWVFGVWFGGLSFCCFGHFVYCLSCCLYWFVCLAVCMLCCGLVLYARLVNCSRVGALVFCNFGFDLFR